jgi:regulator of protease activity HflC (stomatin/prohibitin superfamily)
MKAIIAGVLTLLGIIIGLNCFTTVDVGESVVVVGFGNIKGTLSQGVHAINPFYSTHTFNLRNNKYETIANSATADIQKADIAVTVNYNIEESKVAEIYQTYGNDFMGKVFAQNVQEAVKSASAHYTASELVTKRDELKATVKDLIAKKMPNIITITDVAITNVDFSDSFDQSIEAKVRAEQEALTAKANLEKKRYEAEAIKAQAEAINHAGGAEYVQLKWIEKWNGALPTTQTGNGALISLPIK